VPQQFKVRNKCSDRTVRAAFILSAAQLRPRRLVIHEVFHVNLVRKMRTIIERFGRSPTGFGHPA
jgi:hypothetical protein